eukprot:2271797-Pyramimonas_sp.AAC.1
MAPHIRGRRPSGGAACTSGGPALQGVPHAHHGGPWGRCLTLSRAHHLLFPAGNALPRCVRGAAECAVHDCGAKCVVAARGGRASGVH